MAEDPEIRALMAEAYSKVQRLIYRIIHTHIRRYGGDWEEYLSVANEHFVSAAYSWDPSKGAFTTHVYNRVFNGIRNYAAKKRRLETLEVQTLDAPSTSEGLELRGDKVPDRSPTRSASLWAALSTPAREVLSSLLDSAKGRRPAEALLELAKSLAEAGWACCEILKTFNEIREAFREGDEDERERLVPPPRQGPPR